MSENNVAIVPVRSDHDTVNNDPISRVECVRHLEVAEELR